MCRHTEMLRSETVEVRCVANQHSILCGKPVFQFRGSSMMKSAEHKVCPCRIHTHSLYLVQFPAQPLRFLKICLHVLHRTKAVVHDIVSRLYCKHIHCPRPKPLSQFHGPFPCRHNVAKSKSRYGATFRHRVYLNHISQPDSILCREFLHV